MTRPLKIKREKKLTKGKMPIQWSELGPYGDPIGYSSKEVDMVYIDGGEWGYHCLFKGEVTVTHLPSGMAAEHFNYEEGGEDLNFFESPEKLNAIDKAERLVRELHKTIFPTMNITAAEQKYIEGLIGQRQDWARNLEMAGEHILNIVPYYRIWREKCKNILTNIVISTPESNPADWDDDEDVPF